MSAHVGDRSTSAGPAERRVATTLNQFVYYPPAAHRGRAPALQERQQGLICIRMWSLIAAIPSFACLMAPVIQLSLKTSMFSFHGGFVCVSN